MFQPPAQQKTTVLKQVKLKIACLIFPQVLQNQFQRNRSKKMHARHWYTLLNALLARAMHACGKPFCMIENSYWQAFFKAIRPAYVVPSRYGVSEPLLVSKFEKTREEILIKVAESDAVAIMCDGWSNLRHEPIINLFLSVPQSAFWKSIHTEVQSHTREYTEEAVSGVIDEVK